MLDTRAKRPEDGYVDVEGLRARYWAQGARGEAVLLLHGLGASVESWIFNVDALARHHRVVCLDMLGFGKTDKPAVELSIQKLAAFVVAFMNALSVDRSHVVGHSLGGAVALEVARTSPHRVDKVVLAAPAGAGPKLHAAMRWMNAPLLGELLTRPSRALLPHLFKLFLHDPAIVSDALLDEYYAIASLPGAQRSMLNAVRASTSLFGIKSSVVDGVHAALRSLEKPPLVLWGRQDRIAPVEYAEACARSARGAEVHLFDECGHALPIQKAEAFNARLLRFLARGDARSATR